MSKLRITALISSIVLAAGMAFFLFGSQTSWSTMLIFLVHIFLAVYFFAVLVSNQQYEEDAMAKIERIGSAIFFSYAVLFQMLYAPIAKYFFSVLIKQRFFFSDFLALFLFLLFLFLFVVSVYVFNGSARTGFFSSWHIFNSATAYFVLRNLFFSAVLLLVFLFYQAPFIIITA